MRMFYFIFLSNKKIHPMSPVETHLKKKRKEKSLSSASPQKIKGLKMRRNKSTKSNVQIGSRKVK